MADTYEPQHPVLPPYGQTPQVIQKRARGAILFLLPRPHQADQRPAMVGRYSPKDRTLTKRFMPAQHFHRNGQGTGLNLEMVQTLDRMVPRPLQVVLVHGQDRTEEARIAWTEVVSHTRQALAELEQFRTSPDPARLWHLRAEDIDLQVLVPMRIAHGHLVVDHNVNAPLSPPAAPDAIERSVTQLGLDIC